MGSNVEQNKTKHDSPDVSGSADPVRSYSFGSWSKGREWRSILFWTQETSYPCHLIDKTKQNKNQRMEDDPGTKWVARLFADSFVFLIINPPLQREVK